MKKVLLIALLASAMVLSLAACAQQAPADPAAPPAPPAGAASPAAPADPAAPPAAFTPAAQIVPPPGKVLRELPVDMVSETPLRIASVMMHTNPFGAAVAVGSEFAGEILADRNVTVNSHHMEGFDVHDWTITLDSMIAAGYDVDAAVKEMFGRCLRNPVRVAGILTVGYGDVDVF